MWVKFINNPCGRLVGDCAVRAVANALNTTWEDAFLKIVTAGYGMCDMPSSNSVIWAVLRQHGFKQKPRTEICDDCYTVRNFCSRNPKGIFVIFTSGHVVCAIDGNYYDSWDSGNEIVLYVWYKDVNPVFDI